MELNYAWEAQVLVCCVTLCKTVGKCVLCYIFYYVIYVLYIIYIVYIYIWIHILDIYIQNLDFPGGSVVKNLPASAGDIGSIPGPGRSHMPQSN